MQTQLVWFSNSDPEFWGLIRVEVKHSQPGQPQLVENDMIACKPVTA